MTHHRRKKRRNRRNILRAICAILGIVLVFFGTGEIFQGSKILGIILVAGASVILLIFFTIRNS